MTKKRRGKKPKPLLVDVVKLGHCFRDAYLAGIKRLLAAGKLQVQDRAQLDELLSELATIDWAVYIQPPPKASSKAEHVVRYLARYMTGGPISDARLLRVDEHDRVHFQVRSKDKSGRKEEFSLSGVEFVHQWSLHILPPRFFKVRCFGQWSYTKRAGYQELCQRLQPPVPKEPDGESGAEPAEVQEPRQTLCPVCKQQGVEVEMRLIDFQRRPSWREVFYGPDHPPWFERVHMPAAQPQPRGSPVPHESTVSRGASP